jgi:hypothetical protein
MTCWYLPANTRRDIPVAHPGDFQFVCSGAYELPNDHCSRLPQPEGRLSKLSREKRETLEDLISLTNVMMKLHYYLRSKDNFQDNNKQSSALDGHG